VLGTWRLVSDDQEMRRLPATGAQLLDLLRQRHAAIMDRRPDKGPGLFKAGGNRVGTTVFVAPDLVEGTLEQGFALARSLESALQRAIFMMFLITEVHPFADGNGRTARIMMNAELVAADEQRIIIPTVYRNNYLAALRAMTQGSAPTPLIRTLDYAQRWTHAIRWGTVRESQLAMEACNAFYDPNRADQDGVRLKMPDDV
jgi:Fic family protein